MEIDETPEGGQAYGPINRSNQNPYVRWRLPSLQNIALLVIITCVTSLSITFITLSIVLLASTSTCNPIFKNEIAPGVCVTDQCIYEAARILKNLDTSVNPCDDFYQFSCGNFIKTKRIPEHDMFVSTLGDLDDKFRKGFKLIFDINYLHPNGHNSIIETFYQNCMHEDEIEKIGLQTIEKIFKEFGGWPVIKEDSWKEKEFHWIDLINKFTNRGFTTDYIFQFNRGYNYTNSSQIAYHIDEPRLGLSSQFLKNGFRDKFVIAYFNYMLDIAVILGANETRAEMELKEVMVFQKKLARSFLSPEDQRDISHFNNPMTIKEMEIKYSNIPWKKYFKNFPGRSVPFKDNDVIIVHAPLYFEKLNDLLTKTTTRTMANFIFWRSIESIVKYLPRKIREAEFNYRVKREGIVEKPPRWKECIDSILKPLDSIITFVYYSTFYNRSTTPNSKDIVSSVYSEFMDLIKNVDWMGEEVKTKAVEKAKAMKFSVGEEYKNLNEEAVVKKYENLYLKRDGDFLESFLTVSKHKIEDHFYMTELDNTIKLEWQTINGPGHLNPSYDYLANKIEIPSGILQDPFGSDGIPFYLNYGTVGFIAGHEVYHGFDDKGHQFDKYGNLNNWWDEITTERYSEKAKCFVHQYGNYISEQVGQNLNGNLTLGENIADNVAVKTAYSTYKKWVKKNGPEKRLPGLVYTPMQLFWINMAQTWCSKYRPEIMRELIVTDFHSTDEFRIKGSVSNSPEFSRDFRCPRGSKMNPEKKCDIL